MTQNCEVTQTGKQEPRRHGTISPEILGSCGRRKKQAASKKDLYRRKNEAGHSSRRKEVGKEGGLKKSLKLGLRRKERTSLKDGEKKSRRVGNLGGGE